MLRNEDTFTGYACAAILNLLYLEITFQVLHSLSFHDWEMSVISRLSKMWEP